MRTVRKPAKNWECLKCGKRMTAVQAERACTKCGSTDSDIFHHITDSGREG